MPSQGFCRHQPHPGDTKHMLCWPGVRKFHFGTAYTQSPGLHRYLHCRTNTVRIEFDRTQSVVCLLGTDYKQWTDRSLRLQSRARTWSTLLNLPQQSCPLGTSCHRMNHMELLGPNRDRYILLGIVRM